MLPLVMKMRLAVRDQAGRYHRDHPADPLQGDVLVDRDIIVGVGAGLHFDRVAVLRSGNCGGNGRKLLSWANGKTAILISRFVATCGFYKELDYCKCYIGHRNIIELGVR